jgi:D-lactate dehydrogenase (cytochrome)
MTSAPTHGVQRAPPEASIVDLRAQFDARCSVALAVCEQNGRDESAFEVPPPQVVVFALNSAEVASTMALANQYKVPGHLVWRRHFVRQS